MNPEMQILLDVQRGTYIGPSLEEERQAWRDYAKALPIPRPAGMLVTETTFPTAVGPVRVWIYRAKGSDAVRPAIVYMHGGGFNKGDPASSDGVAWGFASQARAVVVSVDYRLTPEHPFPAAFDDCYGVLCHLAAHGAALGIDQARIALAGDSPGGRMAAGMALKARDCGGPRIRALAMIYANGGMDPQTPSASAFADGYGLTKAKVDRYMSLLFPTDAYDADPYAWPVRASDHSGLPPTLVQPAELDPNCDSARLYASKLALAGSPVTFREATGLIGGYMRARAVSPAARAEYDFTCQYLRTALHG